MCGTYFSLSIQWFHVQHFGWNSHWQSWFHYKCDWVSQNTRYWPHKIGVVVSHKQFAALQFKLSSKRIHQNKIKKKIKLIFFFFKNCFLSKHTSRIIFWSNLVIHYLITFAWIWSVIPRPFGWDISTFSTSSTGEPFTGFCLNGANNFGMR